MGRGRGRGGWMLFSVGVMGNCTTVSVRVLCSEMVSAEATALFTCRKGDRS